MTSGRGNLYSHESYGFREPPCSGRALSLGSGFRALLAALCGASIGCGASSSDAGSVASCAAAADCEGGQRCERGSCVDAAEERELAAPLQGCAVLSCPGDAADCCRAVSATATASEDEDYAARFDLVEEIAVSRGEVKASFTFTEAGQQGWVAFQLGEELELSRVTFTGRYAGVADRFLTLSANRRQGGGCVFAFELQPRPAPPGSVAPFVLASDVPLVGDDFCFARGVPGRASELVFGIFASQRGEASLTVSDVILRPE